MQGTSYFSLIFQVGGWPREKIIEDGRERLGKVLPLVRIQHRSILPLNDTKRSEQGPKRVPFSPFPFSVRPRVPGDST